MREDPHVAAGGPARQRQRVAGPKGRPATVAGGACGRWDGTLVLCSVWSKIGDIYKPSAVVFDRYSFILYLPIKISAHENIPIYPDNR